MYNRVDAFLTENNILHEYQFGFRKTITLALIDVIDGIYHNLDSDETA